MSARIAALLVVAGLWCTSCAYYNTFFFAKKYYKEAERARELRTDDKATGTEIQCYEKCVRQCSKVMAEYPNSKYVDDALLLTANSYYWWGRYVDAIKWYGQLQEKFPDSELVPEARFMTAKSHIPLREYVEAENILTQLLKSPAFKGKDRLLFALAEVYGGRRDQDLAIRTLNRLLREYPSSELQLESKLALGEAYFARGAYDSAAVSYEAVARGSGEKEQRIEARKRMGKALFSSGDAQGALDIYAGLLSTVERPATRHQSKDLQEAALVLRIGECQNALGNHERALEMFQRVMNDFPSGNEAAEAEFLTGYTYEIYYEDLDRAKTSYDRVPSHSQMSVFVDEAKRRSQGLGKLKEYLEAGGEAEGEEAVTAEDRAAEGAFLSAELNLFELNKPEEALGLYRKVEEDYPDSPFAPKAAYAAAWVLVNRLDRKEEGMDAYRRILQRYPYTDYADGARRVLGMEPLAAILQGPPLPQGWAPPDTTTPEAAEGVQGPGMPGVADSTAGVGGAGADTTGIGPPVPGVPDSTAGRPGIALGSDTTRTAPDSLGLPMVSESEPPRWPGNGGAPADTSARQTVPHVGPGGEGSPPGRRPSSSDTTGVKGTGPPDTTEAGAAGADSAGSGAPDSTGASGENEAVPDSTGTSGGHGGEPGSPGPPGGAGAVPDSTGHPVGGSPTDDAGGGEAAPDSTGPLGGIRCSPDRIGAPSEGGSVEDVGAAWVGEGISSDASKQQRRRRSSRG